MDAKAKVMMHLEKAKMLADEAGLSLMDMIKEMEAEEGESEDMMEEDSSEEEMDEEKPKDKAKIALIVAKMKNGMKAGA